MGRDRELELQLLTVAGISRAAGFSPELGEGASPRREELFHEAAFFTHELMVYRAAPATDAPWDYVLSDPADAEAEFQSQPYVSRRKMALARAVQLASDLADNARDAAYADLTTVELLAVLAGERPAPGAPGGARGDVHIRWGRARA